MNTINDIKQPNYNTKSNCRGSSAASYQMLANLYKNKMNQPERAKTVLEEFRNKSNK
jgi:hypothetical protein